MLNVRNYLEDIHHIICVKSPAQLKMFVYRYMADSPDLKRLLNYDRPTLKLHLYHMKKEVLPLVEEHLHEMSDDR